MTVGLTPRIHQSLGYAKKVQKNIFLKKQFPTVSGPTSSGRSLQPAEFVLALPWGTLRYYIQRDQIVAFCGNVRMHGRACKISRILRGIGDRGRPLGLLVAWLIAQGLCGSKSAHVHMSPYPNWDQRNAARELLKGYALSESFFNLERPQGDGESEEPERQI